MLAKEIIVGVAQVFNDAALFILFGFFVAGLAHKLLKLHSLARHLGNRGIKSVLLATLIGIPLPLCSCSVMPTALLLRKLGANKGATVAFLISTPETGVNSIIVSYGLLGPLFAVFRPIAAFFASVVGGVAANWASRDDEPPDTGHPEADAPPPTA